MFSLLRFLSSFACVCLRPLLSHFTDAVVQYMNPLLTNIHNTPPNHRGLVLGLQDGFFGMSAVIFSSIYNGVFAKSLESEDQNLAGFIATLAIVMVRAITHCPCVPCVVCCAR